MCRLDSVYFMSGMICSLLIDSTDPSACMQVWMMQLLILNCRCFEILQNWVEALKAGICKRADMRTGNLHALLKTCYRFLIFKRCRFVNCFDMRSSDLPENMISRI
jgi:hypothetical protein